MEPSATTILREALNENNHEARLQKISKAVKKLTNILPFGKKKLVPAEIKDLPQLLLMASALFGKSVEMAIEGLLKKLKGDEEWLAEFWRGMEFIANFSEYMKRFTLKDLQKLSSLVKKHRENKESLEKLPKEQREKFERPVPKEYQNFCEDVYENLIQIKLNTLTYLEYYIHEILMMERRDFKKPYEIHNLFKVFLEESKSDLVIVKGSKILENLKHKWKDLWTNSLIDYDIEQILLKKVREYRPMPSETNPMDESPLKKPKDRDKIEADSKKNESPFSNLKNMIDGFHGIDELEKMALQEETNELTEESEKEVPEPPVHQKTEVKDEVFLEGRNAEEDETEEEAQRNKLIIELEKWLVEDDVPLIGKTEFITNVFKKLENFEILVTFVIDPLYFNLTNLWGKRFPELMRAKNPLIQIYSRAPPFRKIDEKSAKNLNSYNMRSFKTTQALCDFRNFRFITTSNPELIISYFDYLGIISRKERWVTNLNHVAKLTEYFIQRDPDMSLNAILSNNLIFRFSHYLDFNYMNTFVHNLIHYNGDKLSMYSIKHHEKMWKYLEAAEFFPDLLALMLYGTKEKMIMSKCEKRFKPPQIKEIIDNIDVKAMFIRKESSEQISFSLVEEAIGWKYDIDRLQIAFNQRKKGSLLANSIKRVKLLNKLGMELNQPKRDQADRELDPLVVKILNERGKLTEKQKTRYLSNKNLKTEQLITNLDKTEENEEEAKEFEPDRKIMSLTKIPMGRADITRSKKKNTSLILASSSLDFRENRTKNIGESPSKKRMNNPSNMSQTSTKNNSFQTHVRINSNNELPSSGEKGDSLALNTNSPHQGSSNKKFFKSKDQITKKTSGILPDLTKGVNFVLPEFPATTKETRPRTSQFEAESRDASSKKKSLLISTKSNSRSQEASALFSKKTLSYYSSPQQKMTISAEKKSTFFDFDAAVEVNPSENDENNKEKVPKYMYYLIGENFKFNRDQTLLEKLYPSSPCYYDNNSLDLMANKKEFSLEQITKHDDFALKVADLVSILVKNSLEMVDQSNILKNIKQNQINTDALLKAVFCSESKGFDMLLKNYLFKIHLDIFSTNNSAIQSGELVNFILGKIDREKLSDFKKSILVIANNHLDFLQKLIVNSYGWTFKRENSFNQPWGTVDDPLGLARMNLVKTLYYILKYGTSEESGSNNFTKISETCWDTVIIWYFEKRTNTIYQKIFYDLMKVVLDSAPTGVNITIFCKLNFIARIQESLKQVFVNGVVRKERNLEEFFSSLKNLITLISKNCKSNKRFNRISSLLTNNESWLQLTGKFGTDTSIILSENQSRIFSDVDIPSTNNKTKSEKNNLLSKVRTLSNFAVTTSKEFMRKGKKNKTDSPERLTVRKPGGSDKQIN